MSNITADFVDLTESPIKRLAVTTLVMVRDGVECIVWHLRDADDYAKIHAQWVTRADQWFDAPARSQIYNEAIEPELEIDVDKSVSLGRRVLKK